MRRSVIIPVMAFLTAAAIALSGGSGAAEPAARYVAEAPTIGGPFTLVDHEGRSRTHTEFRGKPMLVFFGFTNCPHICPMTLQNISSAMGHLGRRADRLTVVFIAVDTKRDTPARLREYREAFDKRIVMLTGSREQVNQAVRSYRVSVLISDADKAGNYTVGHSSYLYLMDEKGRFVSHFRHTVTAKRLANSLRNYLK